MHGLVGYQPHSNSIDADLTVLQHLNLFAKLVGVPRSEREMTVRAIIQDCLLHGLEDTKAGEMSPGQLRKLTLGMALIGKPRFVVLDNPLEGVDPVSKHKLIRTISQYTKKSSLLLATQDCDEAELLCDRIAIMRDAKFIKIGTSSQIIEEHGKGYQIDFNIDSEKIFEQAPLISRDDELIISDIGCARSVLEEMQNTLSQKRVEASFNFNEEFSKDG